MYVCVYTFMYVRYAWNLFVCLVYCVLVCFCMMVIAIRKMLLFLFVVFIVLM